MMYGEVMQGKGGGPRTATGRAAASRNAIRHGILSEAPVVRDVEDPRDWRRHLGGIIESLQPQGWHESFLVDRIAAVLWRLHRVQRYETRMIRVNLEGTPGEAAILAGRAARTSDIAIEDAFIQEVDRQFERRMLPDGFALPTIMRYEAHLHRLYIQTLHELEAIQARRRGEQVALTRLDISAPPGM